MRQQNEWQQQQMRNTAERDAKGAAPCDNYDLNLSGSDEVMKTPGQYDYWAATADQSGQGMLVSDEFFSQQHAQ